METLDGIMPTGFLHPVDQAIQITDMFLEEQEFRALPPIGQTSAAIAAYLWALAWIELNPTAAPSVSQVRAVLPTLLRY